MMEQKDIDYLASLGPIMPADVKPVHVGFYPREYRFEGDARCWLLSRDYWDGERWNLTDRNGENPVPAINRLRWRGAAEQQPEPIVLPITLDVATDRIEIDLANELWQSEVQPRNEAWDLSRFATSIEPELPVVPQPAPSRAGASEKSQRRFGLIVGIASAALMVACIALLFA